jgi:hypothetical protein
MSTPLKFSKPVCIVCGKLKPDRYSLLQSSHSLTQLIFRYCEIDVAEGIVCRNCSRQLNNLHEKVCHLKHQAMRVVSSVHGKRLVPHSSPISVKRISTESESHKLLSPSKIPVRVKSVDHVTLNNEHYRSTSTSSTPSKIPTPRLPVSRSVAKRALFGVSKPCFTEVAAVQVTVEHAYAAELHALNPTPVPINVMSDSDTSISRDENAVQHMAATEPEFPYCSQSISASVHNSLPSLTIQVEHSTQQAIDTSEASACSANEENFSKKISQAFLNFRLLNCSCVKSANMCGKCLMKDVDHARQQFKDIHHWKHGKKSVLNSRNVDNVSKMDGLLRLSWIEICNEFKEQFPKVFYLLVGLMMPDLNESNFVDNILPRIGMIYAVIMQTRACDMSLIQRIVSLILLNANTEIQVSVNCLICNISFCILSLRGC